MKDQENSQPTGTQSAKQEGPSPTQSDKPLVLLHPFPQSSSVIFSPTGWKRLHALFEVVEFGVADSSPESRFDELLPHAFAIIGQPDLPAGRLELAKELRVVCNVEGNFFPNVDYPVCFDKGIYVLGCGPAYAQPVAEYALGLALDLARGISREDRAFREGRERYTIDGNGDAVLLRHANVGLIGFGNLGRALLTLLRPFAPRVRVYDPWLPDSTLIEADVEPATLEDLLSTSTFVFVLAAITSETTHLLNDQRLKMIPDGGRLILVSRAAAIDFPALYERVASGHLLAAIDVWPFEPAAADDAARGMEGLVLSAHRAGGIVPAFHAIGDMVIDDLNLLSANLPPVRMQIAARELVQRYRSRPVIKQ